MLPPLTDTELDELLNTIALTKKQRHALEVYKEERTYSGVANRLGVTPQSIRRRIKGAKKKRLALGINELVAEGLTVKGVSTYYTVDEETGEKKEKGQWVKTDRSKEDELEMMREATKHLADSIDGLKMPVSLPEHTEDGLLTVYITTDMHLGQYAWAKEAGSNVNVESVYNNTLNAHLMLHNTTPNSKQAIVLDLGDTMHSSNDSNRTKSGNELDVDTRHARIFKKLIDLKIAMIDIALTKHERVRYTIVPGNHSEMIACYLVATLSAYYRNEPRFEIDEDMTAHKYYRHGKTLLGFHHGHSTKLIRLPEIMVWDQKDAISSTDFRYWLTGHIHQQKMIDNPIASIESFRNLTKNDNWAQGAGFRGHKQATAITYSNVYGEVARNIVNIAEVEG